MKHYIKPSIEELEVELEQMIAESININNESASTSSDGYYDDSRALKDDDWFGEW